MSLRASGVGARFGGVVALDGVDVCVEPGEIVAVIGPNGSGKSTLFNCITGFVPLAEGEIWAEGDNVSNQPADKRIRKGIARTFQTPRIDPDITVLTSVLCGYLPSVDSNVLKSVLALPGVLRDERTIEKKALQLLDDFGMQNLAEVPMGQLSMGQLRMADVLRAVAMEPKYLLLDEPAAGLAADELDTLIAGIRRIAGQGVGILLVEHNFSLIRKIADRVLVLQKGVPLVEGKPEDVAGDPRVVDAYLGVGAHAPVNDRVDQNATESAEVVLRCEGLTVAYGRAEVCTTVDLEVREGRITALLGPNGAGKSSLLSAVAGVRLQNRRWGGTINLGRRDITRLAAERRPRAGIAFVPEGRGNIFPGMTVHENIALGLRAVDHHERAAALEHVLELFPALRTRMDARAGLLSGGEQQMVAIAMALATQPRVLLLDEPTQGLAPAILDILIEAFGTLRDRGIGILVAEQNQAFAALLADDFLVLSHGEVVNRGDRSALLKRDEIAAAYL
jgi:branched-chain amino acid transport system ATP-binding protein